MRVEPDRDTGLPKRPGRTADYPREGGMPAHHHAPEYHLSAAGPLAERAIAAAPTRLARLQAAADQQRPRPRHPLPALISAAGFGNNRTNRDLQVHPLREQPTGQPKALDWHAIFDAVVALIFAARRHLLATVLGSARAAEGDFPHGGGCNGQSPERNLAVFFHGCVRHGDRARGCEATHLIKPTKKRVEKARQCELPGFLHGSNNADDASEKAPLRLLGLKVHGHAVDAIAQIRRRGPIVEHVAEMAAATAAMHLGAHHAIASIGRGFDRALDWVVEARPTRAALEFLLRDEQWLAAAGAGECARAFLVVERAAAGSFGPVSAQHLVLLGREQTAPLRIGMGDRKPLVVHGSSLRSRSPRRPTQAALRSSSSIDTPSGARRKATRTPGRTVVGSLVNSTPFALSSATTASMPVTVSPK